MSPLALGEILAQITLAGASFYVLIVHCTLEETDSLTERIGLQYLTDLFQPVTEIDNQLLILPPMIPTRHHRENNQWSNLQVVQNDPYCRLLFDSAL